MIWWFNLWFNVSFKQRHNMKLVVVFILIDLTFWFCNKILYKDMQIYIVQLILSYYVLTIVFMNLIIRKKRDEDFVPCCFFINKEMLKVKRLTRALVFLVFMLVSLCLKSRKSAFTLYRFEYKEISYSTNWCPIQTSNVNLKALRLPLNSRWVQW